MKHGRRHELEDLLPGVLRSISARMTTKNYTEGVNQTLAHQVIVKLEDTVMLVCYTKVSELLAQDVHVGAEHINGHVRHADEAPGEDNKLLRLFLHILLCKCKCFPFIRGNLKHPDAVQRAVRFDRSIKQKLKNTKSLAGRHCRLCPRLFCERSHATRLGRRWLGYLLGLRSSCDHSNLHNAGIPATDRDLGLGNNFIVAV